MELLKTEITSLKMGSLTEFKESWGSLKFLEVPMVCIPIWYVCRWIFWQIFLVNVLKIFLTIFLTIFLPNFLTNFFWKIVLANFFDEFFLMNFLMNFLSFNHCELWDRSTFDLVWESFPISSFFIYVHTQEMPRPHVFSTTNMNENNIPPPRLFGPHLLGISG